MIDDLICYDPNNRLTLPQVIGHPWMKMGFDDEANLSRQFSERLTKMDPKKEAQR